MKTTAVVVACLLLCVAANAQIRTTLDPAVLNRILQRKPLGQSVTWRHSCDEVLGAALTMPGAQKVHNRTDGLSFHPEDGSPAPAPYALTVPFDGQDTPPGQDTLVELWPDVPNARDLKDYAALGVSVAKDQELCRMSFPMPYPLVPFGKRDQRGVYVITQKQEREQRLGDKVLWEERAWVCKVGELIPGFVCPKWSGEKEHNAAKAGH